MDVCQALCYETQKSGRGFVLYHRTFDHNGIGLQGGDNANNAQCGS
jgi:hypothetical protein